MTKRRPSDAETRMVNHVMHHALQNYKTRTVFLEPKIPDLPKIPNWGLMAVDLICNYYEYPTSSIDQDVIKKTVKYGMFSSAAISAAVNTGSFLMDANGIANKTANQIATFADSFMIIGVGIAFAGSILNGALEHKQKTQRLSSSNLHKKKCHNLYNELIKLHFNIGCGDETLDKDCRKYYLAKTGQSIRLEDYIETPHKIPTLLNENKNRELRVLFHNWRTVIDKVPGTAEDVPICLALIWRMLESDDSSYIENLQTIIRAELFEKIMNAGKYFKAVKGCVLLMLIHDDQNLHGFIDSCIKTDHGTCRAFIQRKALDTARVKVNTEEIENFANISEMAGVIGYPLDLVELDTDFDVWTIDELESVLHKRNNEKSKYHTQNSTTQGSSQNDDLNLKSLQDPTLNEDVIIQSPSRRSSGSSNRSENSSLSVTTIPRRGSSGSSNGSENNTLSQMMIPRRGSSVSANRSEDNMLIQMTIPRQRPSVSSEEPPRKKARRSGQE